MEKKPNHVKRFTDYVNNLYWIFLVIFISIMINSNLTGTACKLTNKCSKVFKNSLQQNLTQKQMLFLLLFDFFLNI